MAPRQAPAGVQVRGRGPVQGHHPGVRGDPSTHALLDQQENRAVLRTRNDVDDEGSSYARAEKGASVAAAMSRAPQSEKAAARARTSAAPPPPLPPRTPPARESQKVYSSTDIGGSGRRAFAEFSSYVVRKAPPLERKVECTLEELCAGCKKEVRYTRDVVTKNGLIAKKEVTQTIRVKPGWKKGTKVTFEGVGNERPGCLPGDAVFTVSARKHKAFKRQGDDLVLKAQVPLVSALTGWSFSFRLLGGEKVSWSFRDEVIGPGYEKVVRGEGMPVAGGKRGARGDVRVKFDVVFPKDLTDEQRRGLVEILRGCA
ncbi:unnamed protein product [Alopecurus aequalis]